MKAFVLINVRNGQIMEVVKLLRTVPSVVEAHMTFGPYDVVTKVEVADLKEMGNLIAEEIQPIPGVIETLTCLAVD